MMLGDAICDGDSILWEYEKPSDGLSNEDIAKVTVQELENMNFNKWNSIHTKSVKS